MVETYLLSACLNSGLEGSDFLGPSVPDVSSAACVLASLSIESAMASGTSLIVCGPSSTVFAAGSSACGISVALTNRGSSGVGAALAAVVVAAFRVRVAFAFGFGSSATASVSTFFFAAVFVDAARVAFLTTGVAVSAVGISSTVSAFFFLGLLAGAAAAVVLVLMRFLGTLTTSVAAAAAVLVRGFAAVVARRMLWLRYRAREAGVAEIWRETQLVHLPKSWGLTVKSPMMSLVRG